jgi:tRNA-specific 2-thiouridylase
MSGGVDSSVAAALLKDAGYRVIGVTMQVWPRDGGRAGGCCGVDAVEDARKVAHRLDIPHYVLNFRDVFSRRVIADFCDEYRRGRTPNPCIRCNQYIKFDALLEKAGMLGAGFIATGHHARIEKDDGEGRYLLKKGVDRKKDQSYFLYIMSQAQVERTLFPIGHLTKEEVREIARELELPAAERPESQDICFIPDDDYAGFLAGYIPGSASHGPILDEEGNILGTHQGLMYYTVGQRRGLRIAAAGPRYVIAIEPEENALVVGSRDKALGEGLIASQVNWIAMDSLTGTMHARARIRYRHTEAEAAITPAGCDTIYVEFDRPQWAITPGQAVVFYEGDTVLGGGTIEKAVKSEDMAKEAAHGFSRGRLQQ